MIKIEKTEWVARAKLLRNFIEKNGRRPSVCLSGEEVLNRWMFKLLAEPFPVPSFAFCMKKKYTSRQCDSQKAQQELLLFIKKNKRVPTYRSKNPIERRLGCIRQTYTQRCKKTYDPKFDHKYRKLLRKLKIPDNAQIIKYGIGLTDAQYSALRWLNIQKKSPCGALFRK